MKKAFNEEYKKKNSISDDQESVSVDSENFSIGHESDICSSEFDSHKNTNIISLKNVKKVYNGRCVLNIDSLDIEKGKIIAILGPNGSGKTTLFRILAGIEKQDEGDIWIEERISYLTQEVYLFDMSVIQNIKIAIEKEKDCLEKAFYALKKVNMESFHNHKPRNLSGGERQRVAIARTLVQESKIILLDEPAASVDILSTRLVEDYIKDMQNKTKATVLFTTHNPSQALRLADEVIIIWDGVPVERGVPNEILNNPSTQKTKDLLENWRI